MKTYKYLVAGLLLSGVFTSCNDEDFLTEKPHTIYTVDTAFEKSSQVDAAVARAYIAFNYMYGWHNLYMEGAAASNVLGGNGTDCIDSGFGDPAMAAGSFSNFQNLNSNTSDFNTLWNELYQLASYANMVMYGAEQVNWADASEKDYALAQAHFFRGWAYLRLAECFGGVPIVEEYSDQLKFDYERSTREQTYAFAISELEAAQNGLPEYPKQSGRASKGIANHFLAEAYLAQGVEKGDKSLFNKAIEAANKVIANHPLVTERFGVRANPEDKGTSGFLGVANYKPEGNVYYDLFQIGNYAYSATGNTESLMIAKAADYDNFSVNGGWRNMNGITVGCVYRDLIWNAAETQPNSAGPWHDNPNIDTQTYYGGNTSAYLGGTSWGLVGSTDYSDEVVWADQFEEDLRNSQIVRCSPVVLEKTSRHYGEICKKEWLNIPSRLMRVSCKIAMQDGWGWDVHHTMGGQNFAYQFGRDNYIARSAETYLLLAEAYLRNGDSSKAAEAVNEVRKRAQASYLYTTVTMRDILDERARELAYEEHRWPTLLRLGASNGTNEDMNYQLSHYTMYVNDFGMQQPAISWNLFPIPLTVINLNSDAEIAQNPGWK